MKRKVYISEYQIPRVTNLLTENWGETKRKIVSKTLKVLSELLPNYSEEEVVNMEREILKRFFHGRDASNPKLRPLEPLVAKILCGELNYQNKFMYDKYGFLKLKQVLRNIKTLANNGIKPEATINDTLDTLIKRYGIKGEDLEKFGISRENVKQDYNKGEYECVEIEDFEEAAEYGQYTNPNGQLCYTEDEDTWNSEDYSNNGVNTCYVFLRNGWKDEKPVDGEDSPYDDYGLSMIWIFVSPEGEIVTSNTRWNHHNESLLPPGRVTDYSFNETEIADITGYDVNDLDSDSDTIPDFLEKTEELKRRINSGMNVREACNGIVDDVSSFGDGILVLTISHKSTFVKNGQLLYPNFWVYVYTDSVSKQFLKLFDKKAENIMFKDGSLLANDNEWFEDIRYLRNKEAFIVRKENESDIIGLNGKSFLPRPAKKIDYVHVNRMISDNYFSICYGDKEWYVYSFNKNGLINSEPSLNKMEHMDNSPWFSITDENGKINLINSDGEKMYKHGMFIQIGKRFVNGLMEVQLQNFGTRNIINLNGDLMIDEKANMGYRFQKFGTYGVLCLINGKFYVVNKDKGLSLLTDTINWLLANSLFDFSVDNLFSIENISRGRDDIAIITIKYDYEEIKNIINVFNETVICDDWFTELTPTNGQGIITYSYGTNKAYNILKPDGTLVFNKNANSIKEWRNNYLLAEFRVVNDWRRDDVSYAIVNSNTLEIEHTDVTELKDIGGESNPIPVRFKGYSNYIKPEGGLLNNIKYNSVDYFNENGWAKTTLRDENDKVGYNVVFKDGSILSNELYEKILGGTNEIIAVEKEDREAYVIEIPSRKETKYTYDMFPYLYKKGLGKVFGTYHSDRELVSLNIIEIGIKKNPCGLRDWRTPECVGYNFANNETKEFILPKFYDFVDTKDGKIFTVYDNKREDIIDMNGKSLLGGRTPIYVDSQYSDIGSYRVDFEDNNGNRYMEFYDDNFNLIQRMTNEEYDKWWREKY